MLIKNNVVVDNRTKDNTVQVRVKKRCVVGGYAGGTVLWVTPKQAKQLHALGGIDIIGGENVVVDGSLPAPTQAEATQVGKFSDTRLSGHTIDTVSSIPSGQAKPSLASEEGQASTDETSTSSSNGSSEGSAESSQSTTHTDSAQAPTSSTSQTTNGGGGTKKRWRS